MTVRTRFAPSPTGYLHIGGARTALFSWAYARKLGGQFILRVEDTDVARSTPEAVQAILDGMQWLGIDYDEGPFYQMQRMEEYKVHIQAMLASGHAYLCYCTKEELEALRESQMVNNLKPRYDGRWRPEEGKVLPSPPEGIKPVVRFKNPQTGAVTWNDLVKGHISIANEELDDLIISRGDGTPTYNFCVVVDDWEMSITHVIRGDDHVNNTPRQINMLTALGATIPQYAHLSMILGDNGQKLSKRHGAVSVIQYDDDGYLPEAVLNYLARLGWSHGDDEIFSREQFVAWFNLDHLGKSAAQFDEAKLRWVNAQHLKAMSDAALADLVKPFLLADVAATLDDARLLCGCGLFKDRCSTLVELASWLQVLVKGGQASSEDVATHVTDAVRPALALLADAFASCEWNKAGISAAIKQVLTQSSLKMPQLAMPVRVLVMGTPQTPSLDAILELIRREDVIARLKA